MKLISLVCILLIFNSTLADAKDLTEQELQEEEAADLAFDDEFKKIGIGIEIMPTPYNQSTGVGIFWRINSNWSAKLNGGSYGGNFDFSKGYIVMEARYYLIGGLYTDFGVGTWTAREGFANKDPIGFRNYGPLLELGWSAFEDEHWSLGLALMAMSVSVNGADKTYFYVNGLELVYYFI